MVAGHYQKTGRVTGFLYFLDNSRGLFHLPKHWLIGEIARNDQNLGMHLPQDRLQHSDDVIVVFSVNMKIGYLRDSDTYVGHFGNYILTLNVSGKPDSLYLETAHAQITA
jgi:hypothetical protein